MFISLCEYISEKDVSLILEKKTAKMQEVYSYEDTVSKLGIGKFHYYILLLCGCSIMSSVIEGQSIGFILPYIGCDMAVTPFEQGILNSVGFIGIILSSHFWGFMADTWGRKKVIQTSVITAFVFSSISSFATNIWTMIVLRLIVGLWYIFYFNIDSVNQYWQTNVSQFYSISGVQCSGIAYLGEFHSNKTRSMHVTFTAMFLTLSVVYAATIGWLIIPAEWTLTVYGFVYKPWRLYILCNTSVNFLVFVVSSYYQKVRNSYLLWERVGRHWRL